MISYAQYLKGGGLIPKFLKAGTLTFVQNKYNPSIGFDLDLDYTTSLLEEMGAKNFDGNTYIQGADGKVYYYKDGIFTNNYWKGYDHWKEADTTNWDDETWKKFGYEYGSGNDRYRKLDNGTYQKFGDDNTYGVHTDALGNTVYVSKNSNINAGAGLNSTTQTAGTSTAGTPAIGSDQWYNGLSSSRRLAYDRQKLMLDNGVTGLAGANGGADGIWGQTSQNAWYQFLTTDAGKTYAMNHDMDTGAERRYTNSELMGMSDDDAKYLTQAGQDARAALIKQNDLNNTNRSNWRVGDLTFTNYTDYKTAADTYNAGVRQRNQAGIEGALNSEDMRLMENQDRIGTMGRIGTRRFDAAQKAFSSGTRISDMDWRERRDAYRAMKRARRRGVKDEDMTDFFTYRKNNGYQTEDELKIADDVKTIDKDAYSYKQGGLISYRDYLKL